MSECKFHGQPLLRGVLISKKEWLVENLHEEPIVCERMGHDHVNNTQKSITEIPITNAFLKSCKLAHSRYATALKEKKENSDGGMKNRK